MGGSTRRWPAGLRWAMLGLCYLLLVRARNNPHFLEGCGGWEQCLSTHSSIGSEPLVWFGAWTQTLQPKLDRLLVTSRQQQEGWSKDNGLLIIFSGDSTIIQQFQVLGELLRRRNDFHPVTGPDAEKQQKYELTFGAPRGTPGSVTFLFYRVFEACLLEKKNAHVRTAYAMYFGCGMHLLHLYPVQFPTMMEQALRSWERYEFLLSDNIQAWRKLNPGIKLVYMSTHTIDESKYFGKWGDTLQGYKARDPTYLESCKLKFESTLPKESRLRENLEEACIDTVFGARGVQLLNERGLSVMKETGVPVVPAHMLVEGQQWATPEGDGRHYPYLIPMELFWLLNTLEDLP
eukprot:g6733.t1